MVKQAIIVRKDLNMRKGKLAAQVAHASMNIFLNKAVTTSSNLIVGISKDTKEWLETSYTKIVLGCNSLEDLYKIRDECIEDNIPYAIVQDLGKTEFHNIPTETCIAIGPAQEEIINAITKDFKLL
jgi:PTH2 family peptidyl-tRNA hydrolase